MQPAVFERTGYYTILFQKVKLFFHIFVCFLCGEGVTFRRSSPDSRSRGLPLPASAAGGPPTGRRR